MGFGLCTTTPKRQIAEDNPLKFLTGLFNTIKALNLSAQGKTQTRDKVQEGDFTLQELEDVGNINAISLHTEHGLGISKLVS